MAKAHLTITLDADIVELGKAKNINFSGTCNQYLREYLMIDEERIPKERDQLIEHLAELKAQSNIATAKLNAIKEKEKFEQQKELEKRMKREEDIKAGRILIGD